ncbi:MAG: hypothetical protein ACPGXL_01975 [Chitinophagales bacterium]
MSKRFKFAFLSFWILITRSYDAYATYQYTPDLSHEANPLVSILGLGWLPLLSIVGCLTLFIIYAYYVSLFKSFDFFPQEQNYSFSDFIGYVYTGKKTSWASLLYKIPTDFQRLTHYTGHVFAPSIAFAGVISTLMWFGINYTDFYRNIHSIELVYGSILIGSAFIIFSWFKQQYQQYRTL